MRALLLLGAALLGACVSVSETPIAPDAIQKGQRVAVVVYPSPSPAMTEKSSNMDQMAKVVPGLGFFISATQNTRDLDASRSLQRYLPAWQPEKLFMPILMKELATSGSPGRFVTPADAGITDEDLGNFNRSDNVTDWLVRYCVANPTDPAPRKYSAVPGLHDALVLEVNLAYGAPADGADHWTPNLDAVTKLYRANDLALLWRHENVVQDPTGMRLSADYEKNPGDMVAKWREQMPALAKAIASDLTRNLQAAGLYVTP